MKVLTRGRNAALAVVLAAGALAAPAAIADTPSGSISFSGGSVAFIAGVNWGSGTLRYQGRSYPVKVSGIGIGSIGANKFQAVGSVYNLHKLSDINGTYTAIQASATFGGGVGTVSMQNAHGVVITAKSTSAGLNLTLAPSGMGVQLK